MNKGRDRLLQHRKLKLGQTQSRLEETFKTANVFETHTRFFLNALVFLRRWNLKRSEFGRPFYKGY